MLDLGLVIIERFVSLVKVGEAGCWLDFVSVIVGIWVRRIVNSLAKIHFVVFIIKSFF